VSGDNGAGKSTLIKIISGVHGPDSGEILVHGNAQKKWDVNIARAHGIETVYQDRALAEQQTITRNIFMGRERGGFLGFLDIKKENEEANNLMRTIGFTSQVFAADSRVFTLSGGERQGVAIARALYFKAKMIILDEPTTALSLTESEKVFHFVRQAKEGGASVVFISHNIYHTYDISDRFVVLDRGRVVLETDKTKTTANELVKSMQDIALSGHAA
jgi:simple sugar transport system ATP-binding protein